MSKVSLPFWKAARLAATEPRLPPCPEDMCEPAFINLLLDTHCHVCVTVTTCVVVILISLPFSPKSELFEAELSRCVPCMQSSPLQSLFCEKVGIIDHDPANLATDCILSNLTEVYPWTTATLLSMPRPYR